MNDRLRPQGDIAAMSPRLSFLLAKHRRASRRVETARRKIRQRRDSYFADRIFRLADETVTVDRQRAEIDSLRIAA
jgi:hypothetical protein